MSNGQVVTFYSFKGGTGRTMALANVAWILAANGKRVLAVDWDLESPGLHRYFGPFLERDTLRDRGGVIDLIREYERETINLDHRDPDWHRGYAKAGKNAFRLNWEFPDGGSLDFLVTGRQNKDYAITLSGMNWDDFYDRLGGGMFFDALREDMKSNYDYALIDSRTGYSDVADICTVQLPDVLVNCFTYNDQGIEGSADVARVIGERYGARRIRILPVPMRIDFNEKIKLDAGRELAQHRFAGLPAGMTDIEREAYWRDISVPYRPFYAYEETLATFGDAPGERGSLLSAYEALAAQITERAVTRMPPMDESVRSRISQRFRRQPVVPEDEIILEYRPHEQVWAEWIRHLLLSHGVRVSEHIVGSTDPAAPATSHRLVIVSQAGPADRGSVPPEARAARPPFAVYVADVLPLPHIPTNVSAHVAGLPEEAAAERILRLIGHSSPAGELPSVSGPRYPGVEPVIFDVPVRNERFTGREDDLSHLRANLQRSSAAVVLLALHGLGGVGKSQVAIEYAYRFANAYDIVWWITAAVPSEVDERLAALAASLGLSVTATGSDAARIARMALQRGEPHRRWLLIFDNAEEIERIRPLLPQGQGHVLVTSRNAGWNEIARTLPVDVFQREESIAHLKLRVPLIKQEEADRIGELLGDLPIAIAAAAAWLESTGADIQSYLEQIERRGLSALPPESGTTPSVEATWDLSLQLLHERSPAALHLLKICSVMASEIPLSLLATDAVTQALMPLDPSVSEPLVQESLVQHISRLALLRLDQRSGQALVHRLLQHVVRFRMSPEELEDVLHEAHLALGASRPTGDVEDSRTWSTFRALWPHLEQSEAITCQDENVQQLLIDEVRYFTLGGDLAQAESLAVQIEASWTQLLAELGEDATGLRRQLLQLRFNIANIRRATGRFSESRALNEEVLAEQQELLGAKHPNALMTAGGLGADLRGLGLYRQAQELDERTHAAWVETVGENHRRTLTARSNLAVSYRLNGNLRKAQETDEATYKLRQQVLPPDDAHILVSATNLGRDLREAGDYERSILLLRQVRTKYVELFGAESAYALNAQANLAISVRNAGQPAEAAAMLEDSYSKLNLLLGPDNPDTLACRLSRSVNLLEVERLVQAEQEMTGVREAYERSLGADHPHTLVCTSNLAALARAKDEPARAKALARTARDSLAHVLDVDHPYAIAAQMNLAIACADNGDADEAAREISDAAQRLAAVLGPAHPHTLRCRANEQIIALKFREGTSLTELHDIVDHLAERIGQRHPAVTALREHRRLLRRIIDPHPF